MTATATFRHPQERFGAAETRAWRPLPGSGFREVGKGALIGLVISLVMVAPGGWKVYGEQSRRESERRAMEQRLGAHVRLAAAPAGAALPVEAMVRGKVLFGTTCAACHKADGTGLPGLGKDLTESWFVASIDDGALGRYIVDGRAATDPLNTTGVPMPPKGGRPELTDADIADIVMYVRGLQDPRRVPVLPAAMVAAAMAEATKPAPATEDDKARALAAAGGDEELAGYIMHGQAVFGSTCSACHGKDGKGLPNLGKSLIGNEFIGKLDEDGFLAFLQKGRDPSDPQNTTGVAMPPKGGNPALSEDDLLDVIAYVRSLQPSPSTP